MDLVGQLVGAGPGGHRKRHLDLHAAPTRAHGPHQAEVAERQAQLGVPDRVQRRLER